MSLAAYNIHSETTITKDKTTCVMKLLVWRSYRTCMINSNNLNFFCSYLYKDLPSLFSLFPCQPLIFFLLNALSTVSKLIFYSSFPRLSLSSCLSSVLIFLLSSVVVKPTYLIISSCRQLYSILLNPWDLLLVKSIQKTHMPYQKHNINFDLK